MNNVPVKKKIIVIAKGVITTCLILLSACGGGHSTSNGQGSDTGPLTFNVVFHGATGRHNAQAAAIDCEDQGVATVQATIYDTDNAFLVGGGPWDCDIGQGTIASVPAGGGRTVVVLGMDDDENIIFRGDKQGIDVVAGSENNAGTINCYTFAPSLNMPSDGQTVQAAPTVIQWNDVTGADEYRVVVWKFDDINTPIVDDTTTETNYTQFALSSSTIHFWQVFAVDPYGNEGIGSVIWSFTAPPNTLPVAQIISPAKASAYTSTEQIVFTGSGSDGEDGNLSGASLVWDSDEYGRIGTGETFTSTPFSPGTYHITLTATDSEEATGTASVVITVATGRVPDTGQDHIDGYTEIAGEDMDYTTNPPSFTKLDASGYELDDEATSWAMIRDNVTGLIWEDKDKDVEYTWEDAKNTFIADLNSNQYGGHADWRLPSVHELYSILQNIDTIGTGWDPKIDKTYFPNTKWWKYWSSNNFAVNSSAAWYVDFGEGMVRSQLKNDYSAFVRAVTSSESIVSLLDGNNQDGTVTDPNTGLMWQRVEIDALPVTWEVALNYCESLELAGYDDWRLPNAKELLSIVDYSNADPSINTTRFPNTKSDDYWSSTTNADDTTEAWFVEFYNGNADPWSKSSSKYMRAVRGGQ